MCKKIHIYQYISWQYNLFIFISLFFSFFTSSYLYYLHAIKIPFIHHIISNQNHPQEPDFKDPASLVTTNPYWTENGMNQDVIDVLSGKGITQFTEVQGSAFLPVLNGRDVIGRSRTGTGKTLAFGIPGLHRLDELARQKGTVDRNGRRQRGRKVGMIVLCPTRELARQVEGELAAVARPMNLFTTVFHGGVSYDPQVSDFILLDLIRFE